MPEIVESRLTTATNFIRDQCESPIVSEGYIPYNCEDGYAGVYRKDQKSLEQEFFERVKHE